MSYSVGKTWLKEINEQVGRQEKNYAKFAEIRGNDFDNEAALKGLDSSLKKTTSIMKKMKQLNPASIPSLIDDLAKINMSKFMEEIVVALLENKIKITDVPLISDLCVAIALRYSSFSQLLLDEFKKYLPLKKTDKITNAAKLRVDLMLLCDLILCGVFTTEQGLPIFGNVLALLVKTDMTEFVNVGLITVLCRNFGWQIADVVCLETASDAETVEITKGELPVSSAINSNQKSRIQALLVSYYEALYNKTDEVLKSRNKIFKIVLKQRRTRGDAEQSHKDEYDRLQETYDGLYKMILPLSASLGMKIDSLVEETSDNEDDIAANEEMSRALAQGSVVLWRDEESKAFYENIMDLRKVLSKSTYEDANQGTVEKKTMKLNIDDIDMDNLNETSEVKRKTTSNDNVSLPKKSEPEEELDDYLSTSSNDWKSFVMDMDHLVSKYSADKAAINFMTHFKNNKGNRKQLINRIATPNEPRMDVVPFYARLVATLENVLPDFTTKIVNTLLSNFQAYIQNESSEKLSHKLYTSMMIAELVKFGKISRAEGLSCLRQLVYDFRGSCIDMTATMLESFGMYLYRNTDSHSKMKRLLEVVKMKRDRMTDNRKVNVIDTAYYTCLPPEDLSEEELKAQQSSQDTPMKKFIRRIILEMNESNFSQFLKHLRRLDWKDKEVRDYAMMCLCSPWLIPIENHNHIISSIAGLCKVQNYSWIGVIIVDSTVETIRLSLEHPGVLNQASLAAASYLSELFIFALCEHHLLLKVMYEIISFPEGKQEWNNFHRLRLITTILINCASYINGDELYKDMEYFLKYFVKYYYEKKDRFESEIARLAENLEMNQEDNQEILMKFPFDVELSYAEVVKLFKHPKKLVFTKNLEDAKKVVEKMESIIKRKIEKKIGSVEGVSKYDQSTSKNSDDLGMIVEEEEEENDSKQIMSDVENEKADYHVEDEEKYKVSKEEEEEFKKLFGNIIYESFNSTSSAPADINVDLSIPQTVKNRIEGKIRFSDETKHGDDDEKSDSDVDSEDYDDDDDDDEEEEEEEEEDEKWKISMKPKMAEKKKETEDKRVVRKVALMTRGKGRKPQVKTVKIDDAELQMRWAQEREKEMNEQKTNKRITLAHVKRIENEEFRTDKS